MRLSSEWYSPLNGGCPLKGVVSWNIIFVVFWIVISDETPSLLSIYRKHDSLKYATKVRGFYISTSMYFVQDSNVWATPRIQSTQVWILDLGISPVRSTVFAIHSVSETNIRIHGERVNLNGEDSLYTFLFLKCREKKLYESRWTKFGTAKSDFRTTLSHIVRYVCRSILYKLLLLWMHVYDYMYVCDCI